jgi:GT2 family glycosyltransferase
MSIAGAVNSIGSEEADEFDAEWYASQYPDVAELGIAPFDHYLQIGKKIGRRPSPATSPGSTHNIYQSSIDSFERFGIIEHNPLISIIVVSFNSTADLEVLFRSIERQTYRNFEVLLIENGQDFTRTILEKHFTRCRYFQEDNVGFAEANNIGLRFAEGELIALINPDTRLSPDALQSLLDSLRYDESAAAAVPKINFFERFIRLKIICDRRFSITRDDVLRDLNYRKLFVRSGFEMEQTIVSDDVGLIELDIPYEAERTIALGLRSEAPITRCDVSVGYSSKVHFSSDSGIESVRISFDAWNCSSARYLVNNAGSSIDPSGTPCDRGFAQVDDGAFFSKSYVAALCGCAALIRRTALLERELFAAPFFAYYEDSELSHWFGQQGYRILYQPEAQVFHRHSESTQENSLAWNVLVGRSKALYEGLTRSDSAALKSFAFNYPEELPRPLRDKLHELDRQVRRLNTRRELVAPKRRTACVYNSYFSSMGGGEKHALDVAKMLREEYDVYLVSETDFDLPKLGEYFSVDMSGIRKIVHTNVDTWFTSRFDVFVNSTFRSNLVPNAADNIYIVSFPHADIDEKILGKYLFLHNSPFTASWARNLWGAHRSETVLPILGEYAALSLDIHRAAKEREILCVGRFTYDGHCKNHHLILDAYKQMVDANPSSGKWKLRILGSCDFAKADAVRYLRDLTQSARGYNVEILPNVDRRLLDSAYTRAAIYIHATGLSVPGESPELHEHFGITTFEALAHDCLPIVYHCGGPAAQVGSLSQSRLFKDSLGLQQSLEAAINDCQCDRVRAGEMRKYAREMHDENQQFAQTLLNAVSSGAARHSTDPERL